MWGLLMRRTGNLAVTGPFSFHLQNKGIDSKANIFPPFVIFVT
jgi:hypothetical protein